MNLVNVVRRIKFYMIVLGGMNLNVLNKLIIVVSFINCVWDFLILDVVVFFMLRIVKERRRDL